MVGLRFLCVRKLVLVTRRSTTLTKNRKSMDATEMHFAYNEAIRQKLDHEHSVMKNRTGWHHIVQMVMFMGFYQIMIKDFPLQYTKYLLPAMGIIYAFSAIYSIWVSEKARASIFMHWNRYREKNELKWEVFSLVSGNPLPHIEASEKKQKFRNEMNLRCVDVFIDKNVPHYFMPYRFISILFIILWIVCLIGTIN